MSTKRTLGLVARSGQIPTGYALEAAALTRVGSHSFTVAGDVTTRYCPGTAVYVSTPNGLQVAAVTRSFYASGTGLTTLYFSVPISATGGLNLYYPLTFSLPYTPANNPDMGILYHLTDAAPTGYLLWNEAAGMLTAPGKSAQSAVIASVVGTAPSLSTDVGGPFGQSQALKLTGACSVASEPASEALTRALPFAVDMMVWGGSAGGALFGGMISQSGAEADANSGLGAVTLNASRYLEVRSGAGAPVVLTASVALTAAAWNHVRVVIASAATYLFVNGVLAGTLGNSPLNTSTAFKSWFAIQSQGNAGLNGYTRPFSGYVAEVAVFGNAPTTAFTPPTLPYGPDVR